MGTNEFKIGETFQFGKLNIKVVESGISTTCLDCVFYNTKLCGETEEFCGSCYPSEREDGESVIFVKVED